MVSLQNYYLFIILELECSTHLELIVNYVATHIIKRFIDCAIHWKYKYQPLVGLEWCIKMLKVCTYKYHFLYTSNFSKLD